MNKEQIREEMKQKRSALSPEERKLYDQAMLESFLQLKEYLECQSLFAYVSFGTEPDTHQLIYQALRDGKKVYVPRVEGPEMEFYRITSLEGFKTSKYGISEPLPSKSERFHYLGENQLMLMPGLAFDQYGGRIGFGAGYFDKYLEGYLPEKFCKVALAYEFQIKESLEIEQHDIPTDILVTPSRIIDCRKSKG